MGVEIERKFLVNGDAWRTGEGVRTTQGYLVREQSHSVRVRIADGQAWLTIKGAGQGITRTEFEYAIPVDDARAILKLVPYPLVEKVRRKVEYKGFTWEVDEFLGANTGLVVAEIELDDPEREFPRPPWIGAEVTHDPRYLNAQLATHPYSTW